MEEPKVSGKIGALTWLVGQNASVPQSRYLEETLCKEYFIFHLLQVTRRNYVKNAKVSLALFLMCCTMNVQLNNQNFCCETSHSWMQNLLSHVGPLVGCWNRETLVVLVLLHTVHLQTLTPHHHPYFVISLSSSHQSSKKKLQSNLKKHTQKVWVHQIL